MAKLEDKEKATKSKSPRELTEKTILRDVEGTLALEIQLLGQKRKNFNQIFQMLKRREEQKSELRRITDGFFAEDSLARMVDEMKPLMGLLRGLNFRIIKEMKKPANHKLRGNDGSFRVLGVDFEVMARLDLWEEDYRNC